MVTKHPLQGGSASSRNGMAALEQDRAAGSVDMRKMRTKSGETVTVSLSVTASSDGSNRVILRFKYGGATIQRAVGKVMAPNRFQALKLGWSMLRSENIVEKEGWSWVSTTETNPNP